jgi:hypothetical protein
MLAKIQQLIQESHDQVIRDLFPEAENLGMNGREKPDETKTIPPAFPPRFDGEDPKTCAVVQHNFLISVALRMPNGFQFLPII